MTDSDSLRGDPDRAPRLPPVAELETLRSELARVRALLRPRMEETDEAFVAETIRVVFVPTIAGHPIGTTEHDPPTYWSGMILEAFVAAFGQRFGEPRIVEGHAAGELGWCPFVVYALAQPDSEDRP